ncbi:MAG: hypothetical protein M3O20_05905 [Acidobacteriota bacterium]|nr:hypothetical protein [Acidobacteriota bacterium]
MGWTGAIVLIAIRLLYIEASLAHAKVQRGTLIFRTGLGVRLLIGGMVIGFSALIIKELRTEEWWVLLVGALFVVLGLIVWPSIITISDAGVDQHVWWRRVRSIPWNEVSGIERSPSGEIQVFGKNGQCIGFTAYHVDPWRFQDEVMRRAQLKTVIDASAPPSLRI